MDASEEAGETFSSFSIYEAWRSNYSARSFNSLLDFLAIKIDSRLDWDLVFWVMALWTGGGKSLFI